MYLAFFAVNKILKRWRGDTDRALQFMYNDYSSTHEDLLEKYKLPSLKIRRIRNIGIETFKIINRQSAFYLHDLIQIKQNKYSYEYQTIHTA